MVSGALTMVQIAAPSRTRIPAYDELHRRVNEEVERINRRFQTPHWKPIVLIERQCNHEEVDRWYRCRRSLSRDITARRHEPGRQGVCCRPRR